jgi:hypothetical protein
MLYAVVSLTIETVWKLLHKQVQTLGYSTQHPDLQIITYKLSFKGENKTGNVNINVIMRRVRVTILARENNKYYIF